MSDTSAPELILNGINPLTGEPLIAALNLQKAANAAAAAQQAHDAVAAMHENAAKKTLGLPFPLHPEKVEEAGWGIVFHQSEADQLTKVFDPLIQHRHGKVLTYNGESFEDWLATHGVAPGTIKPKKVPFYLLFVGDPEKIPVEFTQLLDIEYGIGRLHLDSPEAYSRYAQAVVAYETDATPTNTKEAIFFGTHHINDTATNLSFQLLVTPLADGVDGDPGIADSCNFKTHKIVGNDAKKAALLEQLKRPAGQHPPAFLFSATHGLGFPLGDKLQDTDQGALLCGDWKGLGFSPIPITPDNYVTAADVQDANVKNLIAFCFACFGLATPKQDKYSFNPPQPPAQIAAKTFFSPLPKALLSAPSGPALAVIGHLERAWASSIEPPGAGPQIQPFQNAIARILSGIPLGMALTDFSERYGAFAAVMNGLLTDKLDKLPVDDNKLAITWMQQNDAQAYMLFGDPAIRLRPEKVQ